MSDEELYPSPREALFGNGHVANLYCACKWMAWHLFHVLFLVLATLVMTVGVILMLLYRGVRYVAIRVVRFVGQYTASSDTAARFERSTHNVLHSAKEKPVTRRIYNECPVDIKMDPLWFEGVKARGEAIIEWAEPPTMVWVCQNCGDVSSKTHSEPTHCFVCHETVEWEHVPESEVEP